MRTEAQTVSRASRGNQEEAGHHAGTMVVWRSHKGILESVVLVTCPEVKGLLVRW